MTATILVTVEYHHDYLTVPNITIEDRILNELHSLTSVITSAPYILCDAQLKGISNLRGAYHRWISSSPTPIPADSVVHMPTMHMSL